MPRHNLYKVQPYVRSLCKKHKIKYVIKPLGRAFLDILLLVFVVLVFQSSNGNYISSKILIALLKNLANCGWKLTMNS